MSKWQDYIAPNLGLLFYKQLYKDVLQSNRNMLDIDDNALIFNVDKKQSEFIPYYNDMYEKKLSAYTVPSAKNQVGNSTFSLFTTYPGLLIGSGYMHSTNTTGDAAIGFYFDHTTGLPTIPGSSVKGVLKSLFENGNDKTDEAAVDAIHFIIDRIIENIPQEEKSAWTDIKSKINNTVVLNELKEDIFGSQEKEGKDIFYDVVLDIETRAVKFIGSDYITPHQPNLLKNPIPLQFLKVLPNISFQFKFNLKDATLLNAKQKETLFKKILLTIGVGAKTNVGYGQFSETKIETNIVSNEISREKEKETPIPATTIKNKNFLIANKEKLKFKKGGNDIEVTLTSLGDETIFETQDGSKFYKSKEAVLKKFKDIAEKKKKEFEDLELNKKYTIRFNDDLDSFSDVANFTIQPIWIK
ncbi:MAG TPA: type III-B CRISPR module RAMP protein Cmr6 [Chitinophagales bacterium]|nr:type III-B CRISPR module RAMP protein Cmr6 [Chitinophagales bacterium]